LEVGAEKGQVNSIRRASVGAYSDSSSSDAYHNVTNVVFPQETHRRIDVNAAKNPAVHRDAGPVSFLFTVLRSCPLYDTIAILIVLLQLPPTFLSLIHILFATLTFVPPSSTGHTSFSWTDIFEGSMGTPSVATLVAVDVLVLMVWLFLWSPLQDLSLDLAQTVIALTLGGGTSARDAGFKNLMVCLGIIGVSHFGRQSGVKQSGFRFLFSGSPDSDDPLEPQKHKRSNDHGPHKWIRTILAVHILTQGVVRYIRDWYVRRERRDVKGNAFDPEAANGAVQVDSAVDGAAVVPTAESPINPKKKKKASAQVRIRQPLWAALASTKIVMAKEYETSRAAAESAGANATDANNLGNAPFHAEPDKIWITYVGSDEVCFQTSNFSYQPPSDLFTAKAGVDGADRDKSGVDRTKPIYVRVNGNIWQLIRVNPAPEEEQSAGAGGSGKRDEQSWNGEVFGLAPMNNYELEFLSTVDNTVLFSTGIRTTQGALPLPETSIPKLSTVSAPRSTRPDSPTTTLKTSILTAEAKLNEERARQRQARKEQKNKLLTEKKAIDKLVSIISSSGGNDDRLRQKVQQSNLHAKQAEDAIASLTAKLRELDESEDVDEEVKWKGAKAAYTAQKDRHQVARKDFHDAKATADKTLSALTSELQALQQKRERMQARIAKLQGEYERITDANARGLDEAQRREAEKKAKLEERLRIEKGYQERTSEVVQRCGEMQTALQSLWGSIHALQQAEYYAQQQAQAAAAVAAQQAQQAQQQSAVPSPTTGQFPFDFASGASQGADAFSRWNTSGYGTGAFAHPGHLATPARGVTPPRQPRGRRSSMLSNVSGFTNKFDNSDSDDSPRPKTAAPSTTVPNPRAPEFAARGVDSRSNSSGKPSPAEGHARVVSPWLK
jgi:hypothetical protein